MLRVYDALLAVRGGEQHGRELHTPSLRLQVLASTLLLLQATEGRLRVQAPAGSAWTAMRASWNEVPPLLTNLLTQYTQLRPVPCHPSCASRVHAACVGISLLVL